MSAFKFLAKPGKTLKSLKKRLAQTTEGRAATMNVRRITVAIRTNNDQGSVQAHDNAGARLSRPVRGKSLTCRHWPPPHQVSDLCPRSQTASGFGR
jgi:hypothetical protein